MTKDEVQQVILKYKHIRPSLWKASFIISFLLLIFAGSIYLSLSDQLLLWLLGQVLLAVNILQWFVILHDLGHGHFFPYPFLNGLFGHVASFFVILPFYPWKYIHREHHVWTGWKDKDPTMSIVASSNRSEKQKRVVNFCWKFWVPIMTLSFSFSNFWNLAKLFSMYPSLKMKRRNLFSILFLLVAYATILTLIPLSTFFKIWAASYFIFLMISDPLLLSQHSGVDQYISSVDFPAKKIPLREQDDFTRSLYFPAFIGHFILLGFHKHSLHHIFPNLPGYNLLSMDVPLPHSEPWLKWLKAAKKTPGSRLLFENIREN